MLIVHHLTKRLGDYWALRGVDADYAARLLLLLPPRGAGARAGRARLHI